MRAEVTISSKRNSQNIGKSLAGLTHQQVLVGIPHTTAQERMSDLLGMLGTATGKKKTRLQHAAVSQLLNNAELMYIHTNGSPVKRIPARPVIEPAILDTVNRALITSELELAAQAAISGHSEDVTKHLKRAGLLAENAVKGWFTNPKNNWAPNAPRTIARKGSDKPLIDFGEMRKAVTSIVEKTA